MPKLHLDTDIAGDIDDLCALAMLLKWPGVELAGLTTNSDDGGRRAGYARYALRLAGRDDVRVAAGADVSLGCYRVHPGLPEEAQYWPEPVPPAPGVLEDALDLLQESIEQGAQIVAVGAYTNLALLERRNPGLLARADLTLMGGYVFPPRAGCPDWNHEMDWNVQVDAGSALTVFECGDGLLTPLAMTVETYLRRAHLPALRQAGPLARLIARQAEAFAQEYGNEEWIAKTCPALPPDTINFLHDPLACAIALGWAEGVEVQTLPLRSTIEDSWMRQRVQPGGKPTRVVTRVDGARFSQFWLDLVTRE